MADYITLLGAEQVQSAGNAMRSAAETMSHAASSIYESNAQLSRALTEHAERIEAATNPAPPRLIGWRMADYTHETADIGVARGWANNVQVLPIFAGDPNTKLQAQG